MLLRRHITENLGYINTPPRILLSEEHHGSCPCCGSTEFVVTGGYGICPEESCVFGIGDTVDLLMLTKRETQLRQVLDPMNARVNLTSTEDFETAIEDASLLALINEIRVDTTKQNATTLSHYLDMRVMGICDPAGMLVPRGELQQRLREQLESMLTTGVDNELFADAKWVCLPLYSKVNQIGKLVFLRKIRGKKLLDRRDVVIRPHGGTLFYRPDLLLAEGKAHYGVISALRWNHESLTQGGRRLYGGVLFIRGNQNLYGPAFKNYDLIVPKHPKSWPDLYPYVYNSGSKNWLFKETLEIHGDKTPALSRVDSIYRALIPKMAQSMKHRNVPSGPAMETFLLTSLNLEDRAAIYQALLNSTDGQENRLAGWFESVLYSEKHSVGDGKFLDVSVNGYTYVQEKENRRISNFALRPTKVVSYGSFGVYARCELLLGNLRQLVTIPLNSIDSPLELVGAVTPQLPVEGMETAPQIIDTPLFRKLVSPVLRDTCASLPVISGITRLGWNRDASKFFAPGLCITSEKQENFDFFPLSALSPFHLFSGESLKLSEEPIDWSALDLEENKGDLRLLALLCSNLARARYNQSLRVLTAVETPEVISAFTKLASIFGQSKLEEIYRTPAYKDYEPLRGYPLFGILRTRRLIEDLPGNLILLSEEASFEIGENLHPERILQMFMCVVDKLTRSDINFERINSHQLTLSALMEGLAVLSELGLYTYTQTEEESIDPFCDWVESCGREGLQKIVTLETYTQVRVDYGEARATVRGALDYAKIAYEECEDATAAIVSSSKFLAALKRHYGDTGLPEFELGPTLKALLLA